MAAGAWTSFTSELLSNAKSSEWQKVQLLQTKRLKHQPAELLESQIRLLAPNEGLQHKTDAIFLGSGARDPSDD